MERKEIIKSLVESGVEVNKYWSTKFMEAMHTNLMKCDKVAVPRPLVEAISVHKVPEMRDQILRKFKVSLTRERAWASRKAIYGVSGLR